MFRFTSDIRGLDHKVLRPAISLSLVRPVAGWRPEVVFSLAASRGQRWLARLSPLACGPMSTRGQIVVIMRPAAGGDEPEAPAAKLTTLRDARTLEMVHRHRER
jgi:hypothetical protein